MLLAPQAFSVDASINKLVDARQCLPRQLLLAAAWRADYPREAIRAPQGAHDSTLCPAVLSWPEVVFAGWAGLRGSVSLIMIADFLTHRCVAAAWAC